MTRSYNKEPRLVYFNNEFFFFFCGLEHLSPCGSVHPAEEINGYNTPEQDLSEKHLTAILQDLLFF